MHFSAALVVLGATAEARTMAQRSLDEVNTIMTPVLTGIKSLDVSIQNYYGGSDISQLEDSSTMMLKIIKTATLNASNMTLLTVEEAMSFQPLSDEINAAGDKLLVDLDGKIDFFSQVCVCETVLGFVKDVGDNVYTLMTTVSTKFPQGGQGGDEIAHFKDVFDQMEAELSTCVAAICVPAQVLAQATTTWISSSPTPVSSGTPVSSVSASGTDSPTVAGNGTVAGLPTAVVTAGASYMGVSFGALVLAAAALAL